MKINLLHLAIAASLSVAVPVNGWGQTDSIRPKLYLVSNAHLDSQWKWTVKQTISEYLPHTLDQNFRLFEMFPDYRFNFEGAVKYAWIKEYYPERYEKLKQYVASGRWHLSGALWEAADMIVPSTESFIKNILLGQEFFKAEFGKKCCDIMLPDCFGFPYTLPTIAAHCGLIGFSTQKLRWRYGDFYGNGRKWPFEFGRWRGIDGAELFAALNGGDYTWNPTEELRNTPRLDSLMKASPLKSLYRYYGTVSTKGQADRGGSPLPEAVANICRSKADNPDLDIILAASDSLYLACRDLPQSKLLPLYRGELLMDTHGAGCYTAMASMKHLNRENEKLGFTAEGISALADWSGALTYPKRQLNEAFGRFIWHQFHDDLTGTSIPEVYQISWNDEYLSINQFRSAIETGLRALAGRMKIQTEAGTLAAVIYNPLGVANNALTTISLPNETVGDNLRLKDSKGRPVRFQILGRDSLRTRILVSCTLPAFGTEVLEIGNGPKGKAARSHTDLKVSDRAIENGIYRIEVDEKGDIRSIYDKRYGKELVGAGKTFSLVMLEKNRSDEWPAWEIYKSTLDQTPAAIGGKAVTRVEERGPLRAVLRIERQYNDTKIVQRIMLTDGAADDRIDIENRIDWREAGKLMKAAFPFSFSSPQASYDLGLGYIRRGNNSQTAYEVYAQRWADLTAEDGSYGVTLLTDGKYGWDKPDDHTLRLSLFHSPSADKNRYVSHRYQDWGTHRFTYSIRGHKGEADAAATSDAADIMSHGKPVALVSANGDGVIPASFSFARSTSAQLNIRCLKKAEDGDGYIVRIYNPTDRTVERGGVDFFAGIANAEQVNGIEEYAGPADFRGHRLTFDLPPFSIKSFRVRLQPLPEPARPRKERFIELPFDRIAITSNAFRSIGRMDRAWRSYAAEQMPDTLCHNGVKFVLGRPDFKNALACKGQTLEIPRGCAAVYLLAASSEGDRTALFSTDNGPFRATVPQWTGLFGQCTMKDLPAPFVKQGDIAYVGGHRHDPSGKDEVFERTYLFLIRIPVDGARSITLPDDEKIVVFAATALQTDLL